MSAFWRDVRRESADQAAYAAKLETAVKQPCAEGCCYEWIDADTGESLGGWGPVGCACQDES